jgi:hypothetical protein
MSEHQHQKAVFEWVARQNGDAYDLIHAVPNGGQRHIVTATKLKHEGVKPGVFDIDLPVARGGFTSLRIEMKFNDNNLSKAQREWMTKMQKQGHCCVYCYDWQAATRTIIGYLGMAEITLCMDGLN